MECATSKRAGHASNWAGPASNLAGLASNWAGPASKCRGPASTGKCVRVYHLYLRQLFVVVFFFFFFLCVCVCVCVCVSSIQCRVCQQNGLGLRQIGLGLRQKWTANNVDSSKQVRTETEPQKSRNLGQSEIVRNRLMGRAGSMMKNKKVRWRTKFHSIQSFKRLEKSD